MDPLDDLMVLNTEDEETSTESPTGEDLEQETPAAEGETDETGVSGDETEPAGHEESVPYERLKEKVDEVNTLAAENAKLKTQQEVIGQLVSHPSVLPLVRKILAGEDPSKAAAAESESTPKEDVFTPLAMPAELDQEAPENHAILNLVNGLRKEVFDLKRQLREAASPGQSAAQQLRAQEIEALNQRFVKTLEPLETRAGIQLSEEERDRVAARAAALVQVDRSEGLNPTLEEKLGEAFYIVASPKIRALRKKGQQTKTGLEAPGGVNGKVTGPKRYANTAELMDALYEQAVGKQ